MTVFITFFLIWFFLPIGSEIVRHITTPAMARVSMEIEGFWDVMEDPTGYHTRQILMMDSSELASLNADHPVGSAVEPPRGSWK